MNFLKYWVMGIAVVISIVAIFAIPIGFLCIGVYWFGDLSLLVTVPVLAGFVIGMHMMIGEN